MSFRPQSVVFVRICPFDVPQIFDSRLVTHSSNLAFSSQIAQEGFYPSGNVELVTLKGTVFEDLFFARKDLEDDPYFAIKESNARKIIFTNVAMGAGVLYTNSPAVTGPVVTFRGDKNNQMRGVNLMDNVVRSIEFDLNTKANNWDAQSYANIVSLLQPIRALSNLLDSIYSSAVVCSSLTRLQIARELAKNYDAFNQINSADIGSAQKAVYAESTSANSWTALMTKLDGSTQKKIGYLAISILFRNSTPRAKDVEFKLHIKISSHSNSQTETEFLAQHTSGFNQIFSQYSGFSTIL
jgi:hypothetical protein